MDTMAHLSGGRVVEALIWFKGTLLVLLLFLRSPTCLVNAITYKAHFIGSHSWDSG